MAILEADRIAYVALGFSVIGFFWNLRGVKAAEDQAIEAKTQSAIALTDSKSAYQQAQSAIIQAEAATKSNHIAVLENRVQLFKDITENYNGFIKNPRPKIEDNQNLLIYRNHVSIAEFYFSHDTYSSLWLTFEDWNNLTTLLEEFFELKESGAPRAEINNSNAEILKLMAKVREGFQLGLSKMRLEMSINFP